MLQGIHLEDEILGFNEDIVRACEGYQLVS